MYNFPTELMRSPGSMGRCNLAVILAQQCTRIRVTTVSMSKETPPISCRHYQMEEARLTYRLLASLALYSEVRHKCPGVSEGK
jgi:hypothetical protein